MKRVLQSRLNPPVKPEPEIIIKEVIKEVPVYQPAQIITKEVIKEVVKEVQDPRLIEELSILKQQLAKKDELFNQVNFEKNSLTNEIKGLKEDKIDLRADKLRLREEIDFLRKSELIHKEQLLHKTLELEQLSKMFNEISIVNSSILVQEEKIELNIAENKVLSNNLFLNGTGESIYPSNNDIVESKEIEKSELLGEELDSFSLIN
jgi:ribosomal protein S25